MPIFAVSLPFVAAGAITIGRRAWKDRGHNIDYVRPLAAMVGDRYNFAIGAFVAIAVLSTDGLDGGLYAALTGTLPTFAAGFGAAVLSRFVRDRVAHRGWRVPPQ